MARRYDWVSMNIALPTLGKRVYQAKAFDYPTHNVAKEHQNAAGYFSAGHTRDSYKIDELTLELLQGEADEIRTALGNGYMLVAFDMTLTFRDTGLPARTDRFQNCHITGEKSSVAQGTDGNTTTFTIKPDEMILGGIRAIPAQV